MLEVWIEGSPHLVEVKVKTWKFNSLALNMYQSIFTFYPKHLKHFTFEEMDLDIAWCGNNRQWLFIECNWREWIAQQSNWLDAHVFLTNAGGSHKRLKLMWSAGICDMILAFQFFHQLNNLISYSNAQIFVVEIWSWFSYLWTESIFPWKHPFCKMTNE